MVSIFKFFYFFFFFFVANKPIWKKTNLDTLKRDLLTSYDTFARPAEYLYTTYVVLSLMIKYVEIDEATSIFTVHSRFSMASILLGCLLKNARSSRYI